MITYELAKKLKDAEFPLNPNRDWDKCDFAWLPCNEITKSEREKLWIPTLSELIEACELSKSIDFALFHWGNWVCGDRAEYEGDWIVRAEGKTPEEAVANLWLELNKK